MCELFKHSIRIKEFKKGKKMESNENYLWENTPGMCEEIPKISVYKPANKISNMAIII